MRLLLVSLFAKIREQEELIRELNSPLRLYNDLEALLEHDVNSYDAQRSLNLRTVDGDLTEVRLNPQNIICIITANEKQDKIVGRKKIVYERQLGDLTKINKYYLNSQELPDGRKLNFESLCTYLDPWEHHLIKVSKGAMIYTAYYNFETNDRLQLNHLSDIDADAVQIILARNVTEVNLVKQKIERCRSKRGQHKILQEKLRFYTIKEGL